MTGILESIVYLSVTAIIVLLFKWIFKNKLSAKWHVLIWALLALRLVLPSLPESSLSIFNAIDIPTEVEMTENTEDLRVDGDNVSILPENNPQMIPQENPAPITPNIEDRPQNVQASTENSGNDVNNQVNDKVNDKVNDDTVPEQKTETPADKGKVVYTVIRTVSILIFLYFVVIYAICIWKNRKSPRVSDEETLLLLEECKKKVGVKRKVYIVNDGQSPMLMGLFKPTIILPDGYTTPEKKDILIHELCHLKSGDIYLLWLAMIVLCLNWYNPIIWVCFFTFRRDVEVYCDERVLKYVDSKKDYAALLVKTALKKNSFIAGTTSLQNGEKEVERRVKYMAYFKKPHFVWTMLIVVVAVVIAVVCLTNPKDDEDLKENNNEEQSLVEKDVEKQNEEKDAAAVNNIILDYNSSSPESNETELYQNSINSETSLTNGNEEILNITTTTVTEQEIEETTNTVTKTDNEPAVVTIPEPIEPKPAISENTETQTVPENNKNEAVSDMSGTQADITENADITDTVEISAIPDASKISTEQTDGETEEKTLDNEISIGADFMW